MDRTVGQPRLRRPALDFGQHEPMLRRYLLTLGAPASRIDDLVQEAFVIALQKQVEDRGRRAIGAWLRATAKNVLLRELRSTAKRREVELADEVWRVEACDRDDAMVDALRHCLRQLPARSRDVLQRAYGHGHGRSEIGSALGIAEEGVKTALRRLRAALRECMQRRLGDRA